MSSKKHQRINIIGLLVLFFLCVSLISFLNPHLQFDLLISNKIQAINSTILIKLLWIVSSAGNHPFMLFTIATSNLFMLLCKLRKEAVFSTLSTSSSALVGSLIKVLINRPRPEQGLVNVSVWLSDKSYPSNHVLVFTVYFGFLLYLVSKKLGYKLKGVFLSIVFILFIATIGISRIYLGAHWATDVVGGYLLGLIWLVFTIRLYNSYNGKR